jgi:hypothetical protein
VAAGGFGGLAREGGNLDAPSPPAKFAAFISSGCPPPRLLHSSPCPSSPSLHPRERPRDVGELVSVVAASFPGGLPLQSPALDLLRRGVAPSTAGTPWRRPSSSIFFCCCGGAVGFPRPDLLPLPRRYFFSQLRRCFAPMTTRGEINPQSPLPLDGDDVKVCYPSCSSLFVRVFSVQVVVSRWIRVSFVIDLMPVVTLACSV